jgi:hypothetical protein
MWIALANSFLSIVSKDCAPDELLVRARREGDIERVFPNAKVIKTPTADYLYRTVVKRADVEIALAWQVSMINYGNFKGAVKDKQLHDAYLRVWAEMAQVQPSTPRRIMNALRKGAGLPLR